MIMIRSIVIPVLLVLCVVSALGQNAPAQTRRARADSPDLQEIRNYRLSMDKVDRYAAASENLMALSKKDPAIKSAMGRDAGVKTIDDSAKLMESKYPAAASAIQKAGLSVREYLVMTMTLVTTTMVAGMKKQGQPMSHMPASVSPENLAFVEQNYPKIESLLKTISKSNEQ